MLKRGDIFANKYEIQTVLHKTKNSIIYLAMDYKLRKLWAIKEIRAESKIKDRAKEEAHILKNLDHPLIPRVTDIYETSGKMYIVMDFVEGENLEAKMKSGIVFTEEQIVRIGKDILDVLSYLHNLNPPIIFRDIKPGNIMLRADGSIRVIDFGIARRYNPRKSNDTDYLGTKGYAAPEQSSKRGQTDNRTDLYSLGVTLHAMLTRKDPTEEPYEFLPVTYYNPALSSGLSKVIEKAVLPDPSNRFQSAIAFSSALGDYKRYDEEFIALAKSQKRKIRFFFTCAVLVMAIGVFSLLLGYYTQNKDYTHLLAMPDEESYISAIQLLPQRTDAYEKLIMSYDPFTREDSSTFLSLFGTYADSIDRKSEEWVYLNTLIADRYLVDYDASASDKERLSLARPFFEEADSPRANAYAKLSYILETYISPESGSLGTKEISADDAAALTGVIREIMSAAGNSDENERSALTLTSANICIGALSSSAARTLPDSILADMEDCSAEILADVKKISPASEILLDKKESIVSSIEVAKEKISGIRNESKKTLN
jgi:serine/threonine-protein kinase